VGICSESDVTTNLRQRNINGRLFLTINGSNCGADPVFGPLSFLKFLFRSVIEGAVAHSREELFSKTFPQETRKGHHFFGHGLSHA
jgi:hypothetical protein